MVLKEKSKYPQRENASLKNDFMIDEKMIYQYIIAIITFPYTIICKCLKGLENELSSGPPTRNVATKSVNLNLKYKANIVSRCGSNIEIISDFDGVLPSVTEFTFIEGLLILKDNTVLNGVILMPYDSYYIQRSGAYGAHFTGNDFYCSSDCFIKFDSRRENLLGVVHCKANCRYRIIH